MKGEVACEKGAVSLRQPINSEVSFGQIQGTSYPADWRPRFADAYRLQLQARVKSIETGTTAGASAWDGYAASAVGEAGLAALASGTAVSIAMEPKPLLYA